MQTEPNQSHAPEASPYASHLPALDGIRGLAVLAVIGSHIFPGNAHGVVSRSVRFFLGYGSTGVDLFFVLSGFLITGILYDSLQDPRYFRKFYARRVLRIFPLYYGVLGLYALGTVFFGMHYDRQLWSLALYLQNTHLIARPIYDYAGPSALPLSHFWSLAVEEQFYLVWPLAVFWLQGRRPLLWLCAFFTLACPALRAAFWLHGWSYFSVHTNTLLRADALLAGAALALLLRGPAHDRTLQLAPWVLLIAGLAAAFILALPTLPGAHTGLAQARWSVISLSIRYSCFDLVYAAAIALALQPGTLRRLCSLVTLRTLGTYSYGLYVLHIPIFSYLEAPLRSLVAQHLTPNKGVGVVVTGLVCFVLSAVAAYLSFHFYEKHFLRLKRYFSYTSKPPNAAPLRG